MKFLTKRIPAFKFAFSGLAAALKKEMHLKIHALAGILVIGAGFYFTITNIEWIMIVTCCCLVIASELMNTAIERTCDVITLEYSPQIKYIKDVSAAAVLILSIGSVIVACFIFWKYL